MESSESSGETIDLRYVAATKLLTTKIDFVPTSDSSGCYYYDFQNNCFVHMDFEREEKTALSWNGLNGISEPKYSNFVAVPSDGEETKFLVPVFEKSTRNLYIVLFGANISQKTVITHAVHWTEITQVLEDDHRLLYQAGKGVFYLIVSRINNQKKTTSFSVSTYAINEHSNSISSRARSNWQEMDGLWILPFVIDTHVYFIPSLRTWNEIICIPFDESAKFNITFDESAKFKIPLSCSCIECKSRHAHSFCKGTGFNEMKIFDGKVFFPVTNNENCSIWSLEFGGEVHTVSYKCYMKYREQIQFSESLTSTNPIRLQIDSNGSTLLFADSRIFQLGLAISGIVEIGTQVEDKLGEGKHGIVWKGKMSNGQDIAAKVMKISFDPSADQKERLMMAMTEARKLTTTDHENIVKGLGFEIGREWFMLVMKLMKETVRHKIDRAFGQRLLEKEALEILQQALEGLVYLHSLKPKPIVHRDLKCSNLLISQREVIKLGDFGLVHTISPTETGSTDPASAPKRSYGSAFWQAPEVVASSVNYVYGRKADVWSIGCCLVEMLTGSAPYENNFTPAHWRGIVSGGGRLSYKPIEFVSESAASKSISILEQTFRNRTKKNVESADRPLVYSGLEGIRPYSWEILADVKKINELRSLH